MCARMCVCLFLTRAKYQTKQTNKHRYVLVVLQYTAKMNAEKLRRAMHAHCTAALAAALGKGLDLSGSGSSSNGAPVVPLAQFRFRLAPEDVSDALTGFTHNAVTPFGLKTAGIPVRV